MLSRKIIKFLMKPVRYEILNQWLSKPGVKILDIGCGNHSASKTKYFYPKCLYHGLDIDKYFNNDQKDFEAMDEFYEVDLNNDVEKLDLLPNEFYDCIIMSHIIEHLKNGEDVLMRLFPKLKKRGIIYIETPSPKAVKLPNLGIGLNFYSDATHIKVYPLENLRQFLIKNNFSIIKSGTRRSLKRILLTPVFLFGSLIFYKKISASIFYDIIGFANYLIASKN